MKPTTPDKEVRKPIGPYLAVGISTVVHGVGERKHIAQNLDIIEDGSTPRWGSSESICRSS